jgi:hypothetical protein
VAELQVAAAGGALSNLPRVAFAIVRVGLVWALGAIGPLSAAAQTDDDHLIVPRQRIGAVALDESAAELIGKLGAPGSVWPGSVKTYNWDSLSATVTKDGAYATQICTTSPVYATAEGVHPGSTRQSVTDLLGPPRYARVFTAWWTLSYTNLYWPGLTVSIHLKGFEADNQVWKICVNHSAALPE